MQITITISPPPNTVTEPDLFWILPQYLPVGYIGKSLSLAIQKAAQIGEPTGYPSTIKGFDNWKIEMSREYQELWFNLLYDYAPPSQKLDMADLKKQWVKLTNGHLAFTNGYGSDTNADFINGTNLDKQAMRQETITCDGNFVKRAGANFTRNGIVYVPTQTINRLKPLPTVDELRGKFWLVHRAIVIRSEQLPDGTYRTNPFDHLRGNPVPVPWANNGDSNALPLNRLMPLRIGEQMPPYYNPDR